MHPPDVQTLCCYFTRKWYRGTRWVVEFNWFKMIMLSLLLVLIEEDSEGGGVLVEGVVLIYWKSNTFSIGCDKNMVRRSLWLNSRKVWKVGIKISLGHKKPMDIEAKTCTSVWDHELWHTDDSRCWSKGNYEGKYRSEEVLSLMRYVLDFDGR